MKSPLNARTSPAAETFRSAFCRRFGCSPEQFEKAVLRRSFPVLARPLGMLALAVRPSVFVRELALIGRLGGATDTSNVRGELEGYAYENQRDKSPRTETFGLRVSRRRFLRVWRETFEAAQAGGNSAPTAGRPDDPPAAVAS